MATVQIITPTAINFLTALMDRIVAARLKGANIVLSIPNLHQRATLLVNETGVLPLTGEDPSAY